MGCILERHADSTAEQGVFTGVALLLTLVTTLAGCAPTLEETRLTKGFEAPHEAAAEYPGLRQLLEQTATAGAMLRVLTVYGVDHAEPGYSRPLMASLAEALELMPSGDGQQRRLAPGIAGDGTAIGAIWIQDYANEVSGQRLRHYELTGSPATHAPGSLTSYPFAAEARVVRDDYLARVRDPFQQALCWVLTDGASASMECDVTALSPMTPDQVAVVAESFGSTLFFDMLDGVEGTDRRTEMPLEALTFLHGDRHRVASERPLVTISSARNGYLFSIGDPRGPAIGYADDPKLVQVLSCGGALPCE